MYYKDVYEDFVYKLSEFYNNFTSENKISNIIAEIENLSPSRNMQEKNIEFYRFIKISLFVIPTIYPHDNADDIMIIDFAKYDVVIWFEKAKTFIKKRFAYYMINGEENDIDK